MPLLTPKHLPVAVDWFNRILAGESVTAISKSTGTRPDSIKAWVATLLMWLNLPRYGAPSEERIGEMPEIVGMLYWIRTHKDIYHARLARFCDSKGIDPVSAQYLVPLKTVHTNFIDRLRGGVVVHLIREMHPSMSTWSRERVSDDELANWFEEQWKNDDFRLRFAKNPRVTKVRFDKVDEAIKATDTTANETH